MDRSDQNDTDGLAQDFDNSSVIALELPQFCTSPSICVLCFSLNQRCADNEA